MVRDIFARLLPLVAFLVGSIALSGCRRSDEPEKCWQAHIRARRRMDVSALRETYLHFSGNSSGNYQLQYLDNSKGVGNFETDSVEGYYGELFRVLSGRPTELMIKIDDGHTSEYKVVSFVWSSEPDGIQLAAEYIVIGRPEWNTEEYKIWYHVIYLDTAAPSGAPSAECQSSPQVATGGGNLWAQRFVGKDAIGLEGMYSAASTSRVSLSRMLVFDGDGGTATWYNGSTSVRGWYDDTFQNDAIPRVSCFSAVDVGSNTMGWNLDLGYAVGPIWNNNPMYPDRFFTMFTQDGDGKIREQFVATWKWDPAKQFTV